MMGNDGLTVQNASRLPSAMLIRRCSYQVLSDLMKSRSRQRKKSLFPVPLLKLEVGFERHMLPHFEP